MSIAIPKYDEFMLPTLRVIEKSGGSASVNEIGDALIEELGLSQAQLDATYDRSGVPIVPDRMSFARSYLKIAGLLASGGRGIWVMTDEGRHAATLPDKHVRRIVADAYNVHNAALTQERKARRTRPTEYRAGAFDVAIDPEDSSNEAESHWSDLLLAKLQSIEPAAFERLCQRLLREHGFTRVEVTGKSGDGGIDGQGVLRVNLVSFHVLFQCKRYKGSVGAPTIRDFRGAMQGRADKGLVITTGTFTPDARREATRDGAPAIDLIDGEALCDLLREVGLGVVVRPVTTYEISVDAAFFDEI